MSSFSGVGLLMYVNTLTDNDRNLLDMMICSGTIVSIIQSAPLTVFMVYRNIFGPIQSSVELTRGFLPNATFGSEKNLHSTNWAKIAKRSH